MRFTPSKPWIKRRAIASTVPTAPAAPDTPSTPSPIDTGTAYYTLLSWTSARQTKADVYLDTVNPPVTIVVPKLQSTSYVPTVLPNTTYYWKVVAFNDGGSATGPVWSFTTLAATAAVFELAGSVLTTTDRARFPSLSIHDVLGAQPNTGSVTFGTAKTSGQAVTIGLGTLDASALIFGGEIQSVDQDYAGRPDINPLWHATLIDHTFRLNKRRPFGTWVDVSASTIARAIAVRYAPDFTTNGVQDNLPAISIIFDGADDYMSCMRRLATAISDLTTVGKTKVDYSRDIKLYLTNPDDESPDPIDPDHPPLDKPSPIEFAIDHSQIRTRVYGKGHAENVPTDIAANETILPLPDAVQYNPLGGQVVTGVTSDGAQAQIVTYEGVQLGGGGTLVGPGVAPSVGPTATVVDGSGLGTGTYSYVYTDITASGESLPSPITTVAVGLMSAPSSAPTAGTPTAGAGPDSGVHTYATSFVSATGETVPGPTSSVTTGTVQIAAPSSAPSAVESAGTDATFAGSYHFYVTFVTGSGETTVGPAGSFNAVLFPNNRIDLSNVPTGPIEVLSRRIYSKFDGSSSVFVNTILDNVSTAYHLAAGTLYSSGGQLGPTSNTAGFSTVHVVPLSAIPIGPSGTTGRKVYRTAAGGVQLKLLTTIADNSTSTFSDTVTDAGLGANALTVGTATANSVTLTGIASGPTATTSRKLYRTSVNGPQPRFLTTIGDNTTTTYVDTTADSSLGAAAPSADTSGLTQVQGQVNAGSIRLQVASTAPFMANGGWAILSTGQVIRYSHLGGGFAPTVGVSGAASAGGSMTPGQHGFALTDVSAAGESLPGPTVYITTGGSNNSVLLNCPVGPTGTIDRYFYVSVAGSDQLHRNGSIGDNTQTSVPAQAADSVFSGNAGPPTEDTSLLGLQNYLLGIPATGPGSITTTVPYGTTVLPAPALTGINHWNGLPLAMAKGSAVAIWVQRDDLSAQVALGQLELDEDGRPTDGIREYVIADGRFGEDLLIATCDADLAQFSRPIVSCTYYTRDIKTKAGRTVSIDLSSGTFDPLTFDHDTFDVGYGFGEAGDFTIQSVDLTFDSPYTLPLRRVSASSVAFTLASLLNRVVIR